ncbi:MAG: hypothetical protein ACJASU_001591 [Cognaticolwellia sp.]|jgi:hypothetical protein
MSNLKPMTKKETFLRAFIKLGKKGLNAEEAFSLGSTCLHSDISGFKNDGLAFYRKRETIKRQGGGTKTYMRYSLSAEGIVIAKRIVKSLNKKRSN